MLSERRVKGTEGGEARIEGKGEEGEENVKKEKKIEEVYIRIRMEVQSRQRLNWEERSLY